jgi:hypothetical protein
MKLGEQLNELRGNILRDRSDLIAGDSDSLWSDESLLRYIRDGERRFARRTLMIRDGHSPQYCQFTLRDAVREYALHELVIALISARAAGQTSDLYRSGHALVQPPKSREVLDFDVISNDTATTGAPQAVYTDETLVYASRGRVTASVYPIPTSVEAGTVISTRVVRLPKGDYTLNDLDRESEIPEDYQLDVLQWAAYRAQANHDGDAGSATSADRHREAFDDAVTRAIRETKRKLFVGTGINYGQNGFTWER